MLLVRYRWNRGEFRFPRRLSLCLSVRPSVCLPVHSVSVHSVFRTFLSCPLRNWLEIWYVNLSWHNTDQVHTWPTFTGVIALCWNLVFQVFLCRLLRYWLEIWITDHVWVLSRLIYFYRSYCPLLKFSFPDFSLLSSEILTWNMVYECLDKIHI